ncbi:hypothetical protein EON68_01660, partial [archaeon]
MASAPETDPSAGTVLPMGWVIERSARTGLDHYVHETRGLRLTPSPHLPRGWGISGDTPEGYTRYMNMYSFYEQLAAPTSEALPAGWILQASSSRPGLNYYWNAIHKLSAWPDATLPHGWAVVQTAKDAPMQFMNMFTLSRVDARPSAPALPPAVVVYAAATGVGGAGRGGAEATPARAGAGFA